MFNILKTLLDFYNDLPLLPERMKIKQVEKVVTKLHDKTDKISYLYKKFKASIKLRISFEKN